MPYAQVLLPNVIQIKFRFSRSMSDYEREVLLGDVFHRMSSLNVSLFQRLSSDVILEYSSS